ncbi:hypothetical protein Palpr_1050 [Paludibacter propionicigenes WB4]|uniref:Uncharacterized protein n=1 Tax=Paludibacter propionicigenes (strain DSM 17365 / JCM 13257 / WB4) TaxID=694427 RepID=E4T3A5_PALPW|nr:hypothetical protein [Paludibacter propionicigenes]ADQ79199.1 hypothetical protein Palpr_1050 [Paludibacter propionicigenes WB4]
MEEHIPEEDEKDESKERLREQLGVDLDRLMDSIGKYMELYSKFVLLQFPLAAALKEKLKELFEKQYPGIKPYIHIWHVNWVFEAMEGDANTLSMRLVNFFEKVEKGKDFKEGFDDYDQYVELYTKPYEAHKTVIEYDKLQLNAEQLRIYEQVVEESYQEDLIGLKELNQERDEFLNVVYMLVLQYFGEQTETLTPDQWLHYDILVGMSWDDYFDDCKELNRYLIKENMQEYPGLDYDHFILKQYEKYREESARENQLKANEP